MMETQNATSEQKNAVDTKPEETKPDETKPEQENAEEQEAEQDKAKEDKKEPEEPAEKKIMFETLWTDYSSVDELLLELETDCDTGLSKAAVTLKQQSEGENTVPGVKRLFEPYDEEAFTIMCLRDSKLQKVEFKDLVPGDIIDLVDGDMIPADCVLIDGKGLKSYMPVQPVLTGGKEQKADEAGGGEAVEAPEMIERKGARSEAIIKEEGLTTLENPNFLLQQSIVGCGSGRAVVVLTGKNTFMGAMASMPKESALKKVTAPISKLTSPRQHSHLKADTKKKLKELNLQFGCKNDLAQFSTMISNNVAHKMTHEGALYVLVVDPLGVVDPAGREELSDALDLVCHRKVFFEKNLSVDDADAFQAEIDKFEELREKYGGLYVVSVLCPPRVGPALGEEARKTLQSSGKLGEEETGKLSRYIYSTEGEERKQLLMRKSDVSIVCTNIPEVGTMHAANLVQGANAVLGGEQPLSDLAKAVGVLKEARVKGSGCTVQ